MQLIRYLLKIFVWKGMARRFI